MRNYTDQVDLELLRLFMLYETSGVVETPSGIIRVKNVVVPPTYLLLDTEDWADFWRENPYPNGLFSGCWVRISIQYPVAEFVHPWAIWGRVAHFAETLGLQ